MKLYFINVILIKVSYFSSIPFYIFILFRRCNKIHPHAVLTTTNLTYERNFQRGTRILPSHEFFLLSMQLKDTQFHKKCIFFKD